MLERDFDLVVIGRNDLSLLFALEQLQRSQSVLILNDGGPQEGGHRRVLGPMEHHFLKAWGDARKIPPLQNLEDYLHPHPLHVFFNGRWVRFGARPSLNMLELFRHFGELFGRSLSLHREFTGARGGPLTRPWSVLGGSWGIGPSARRVWVSIWIFSL